MKILAFLAGIGEKLLDGMMYLVFLILFLYGSYSLWDNYQITHKAFASESLLRYRPSIDNPEAPELQELKAITADVFAWLTVDDTHINYPVVTSHDNMEYINKDIYGEFSFTGAIFLDCQNSSDMTDTYSILYGHHMDNGAMFGDIEKFLDEEFFRTHPSGTLQTIGTVYDIEFFAVCKVNAYDELLCRNPQEKTGRDLEEMISYIDKIAVQKRSMKFSETDRIIGLYTCSTAMTNGRFLLLGKLTAR